MNLGILELKGRILKRAVPKRQPVRPSSARAQCIDSLWEDQTLPEEFESVGSERQ